MHDDQFTAIGPSHHTSGALKAAFSTDAESHTADFEFGVVAQGRRVGLSGRAGRQGVEPGIAGVHGLGRNCKFGVLGTHRSATQPGVGVAGASIGGVVGGQFGGGEGPIYDPDTPPDQFDLVDRAKGDGIGVFGLSGTGPGVRGSSVAGSGIWATSVTGWAVHGASEADRGGVFQSGEGRAQIRLVPWVQPSREPELPKEGLAGDLLLIHNKLEDKTGTGEVYACSLWLCVPRPPGTQMTAGVFWREIQLGSPIEGTL